MRLIDADSLKCKAEELADESKKFDLLFCVCAKAIIDDAPTVDAVEVVRCRKCVHRYGCGICEIWRTYVAKDEYCARGRKPNESKT